MDIGNTVGLILLFSGLVIMIIGSVGILQLPDFFTRTHAASKVDTVGIVIALIGIAFLGHGSIEGDKALLAAFLIMLTNPVSAHALAKAAYASGLAPWRKDKPAPGPKQEESQG